MWFWDLQAFNSSYVRVFFRKGQFPSTEKSHYGFVISALVCEQCYLHTRLVKALQLLTLGGKNLSLLSPVVFITHFIFGKWLLPSLIHGCLWMRRPMPSEVGGLVFHSTFATWGNMHELIRGFLSVKKSWGRGAFSFFFCVVEAEKNELIFWSLTFFWYFWHIVAKLSPILIQLSM